MLVRGKRNSCSTQPGVRPFHRYLYTSPTGGHFKKGASGRITAFIKGGLAALFIKREVRLASQVVKANPPCARRSRPRSARSATASSRRSTSSSRDASGVTRRERHWCPRSRAARARTAVAITEKRQPRPELDPNCAFHSAALASASPTEAAPRRRRTDRSPHYRPCTVCAGYERSGAAGESRVGDRVGWCIGRVGAARAILDRFHRSMKCTRAGGERAMASAMRHAGWWSPWVPQRVRRLDVTAPTGAVTGLLGPSSQAHS